MFHFINIFMEVTWMHGSRSGSGLQIFLEAEAKVHRFHITVCNHIWTQLFKTELLIPILLYFMLPKMPSKDPKNDQNSLFGYLGHGPI